MKIVSILTILTGINVFVYYFPHQKKTNHHRSIYTPWESTLNTTEAHVIADKDKILEAVRKITSRDKTLLVSFINDAFLPLAYSWLCNTEGMGIHDQILIIATDNDTRQSLNSKRPEIATVSISGYSMKGNQTYTHAGYVRLCNKRTQILNWILQENIGIFLFEFDCLWVRNPVPVMTSFDGYDLVSPPVADRPGAVCHRILLYGSNTRDEEILGGIDKTTYCSW